MTQRKHLVVYGAGAIGRGFIPWVFPPDDYRLSYVERDEELRTALTRAGRYTTFKTVDGRYETRVVEVGEVYAPGEEGQAIARADGAITAVGPRNILAIAESLRNSDIPIICCENDPATVDSLRGATGNRHAVFAIPDVVTSNTGSDEIRSRDPLGVITEDGVLYVDRLAQSLGGDCRYVDAEELGRQWMAKLFIHNTPHCIAAYLGSFFPVRYLHEVMRSEPAREIIEGAMNELAQTLRKTTDIDAEFIEWYSGKELRRFSNELLFDPVSRVAREPFRKLAPNERLIGAAQLCLSAGVSPRFLMVGIMAAFFYDNPHDADANIRYLVDALTPADFLRIVLGLQREEALHRLLLARWDENRSILRTIAGD